MVNRIRKVIKKEFGGVKYQELCEKLLTLTEESREKVLPELYEKLYAMVLESEDTDITSRLRRIDDALLYVKRLTKTFKTVVVLYVLATAFVIFANTLLWIKIATIAMLTACMIYRSYEYYCFRYWILDIQIANVYRLVLKNMAKAE